jgi:hypothetical protein
MGHPSYPHATSLLITADFGGSNGARVRLWKWELQQFADRTGLTLTVGRFPPGTSKWIRIIHLLFSQIAMNWRGKPLVSLAVIVILIGTTTSTAGFRVRSELDKGRHPARSRYPLRRWPASSSDPTSSMATRTTRFDPTGVWRNESVIRLRLLRAQA